MKVLFLDIDGVLNSRRTALALRGFPNNFKQIDQFDHVAIGLIRRLCNETGTKIVLSSYWRFQNSAKDATRALNLPIISATPMQCVELDNPHHLRGMEIKEWLFHHPEVTKYAIVDDDRDMLEEQMDFFVKTTTEDGLLFTHYLQLESILKD